ncbi:MAG: ABC transporter permease [Proteobacteria bacterium]|nr:ABC transporter permease [Pseudomonadota bacterium]
MNKFSLVWSNLFRRKVRTFLTLFSVLVAFLLFALLRTVVVAFEGGVELAGVDRLNVSPKYSIIDPLPVSHRNEILNVEGVTAISQQSWFGGSYQSPTNFFPKFPVRPREYFQMYSELIIDPAQLEAFENNRIGAVVPAAMAEQFEWRLGDRIPIEGDIYIKRDGNKLWEFELVGTYETPDSAFLSSAFLFNYDYFNEAIPEQMQGIVSWFTIRVENPDEAAEVAARIDAVFENSRNPTRSATEAEFTRQFASQLGDIGLMMNGILSAVFFTILLLTANTMSQAFRERIPELAVLKTFGFTDFSVSALVLAESIMLCALGGALGIGLAALVSGAIAPVVESLLGSFQLTVTTMASGMAIAVLLGVVVGLVPAISANRLQIVDALRK